MVLNKSTTGRDFTLVSPDMTTTAYFPLIPASQWVGLGKLVTLDVITGRAMTCFTSNTRLRPGSYQTLFAVLMAFFLA